MLLFRIKHIDINLMREINACESKNFIVRERTSDNRNWPIGEILWAADYFYASNTVRVSVSHCRGPVLNQADSIAITSRLRRDLPQYKGAREQDLLSRISWPSAPSPAGQWVAHHARLAATASRGINEWAQAVDKCGTAVPGSRFSARSSTIAGKISWAVLTPREKSFGK